MGIVEGKCPRRGRGIARYDPVPAFAWVEQATMNLRPEVLDCVVFLGVMEDGRFKPKATAFAVFLEDDGHLWCHLVTAEHVISGLLTRGHRVYIRANLKNGKTEVFDTEASDWHFFPEEDGERPSDVAVMPFALTIEKDGRDYELNVRPILLSGPIGIAADLPHVEGGPPDIGDEAFAIGLFRSHYGEQQNIPVLRWGVIAAKSTEPVWTKYTGYLDAYLVELNSIAGLSGSPVFAVLYNRSKERKFFFIGLIHGHFDVQNLNDDVVNEDGNPALGSINTGIAVVIPLSKIRKTMQQESLLNMRKEAIKGKKVSFGATADLDVSDKAAGKAEPATDNPSHKEDFMSLLNVAARANKPAS